MKRGDSRVGLSNSFEIETIFWTTFSTGDKYQSFSEKLFSIISKPETFVCQGVSGQSISVMSFQT